MYTNLFNAALGGTFPSSRNKVLDTFINTSTYLVLQERHDKSTRDKLAVEQIHLTYMSTWQKTTTPTPGKHLTHL